MPRSTKAIVLSVTIALVAIAGSGVGHASPGTTRIPAVAAQLRIDRDVAVPMRDGVILRANVLRPDDDQHHAVLVFRTPYDKNEGDTANELTFHRAVDRGYVVVVQDVRGRFASQGVFDPYVNEGKDGYDTIEWAAAQSWSDGRVGTFGLSYPGAVQWLAAVEAPPHLRAMAPAMTSSNLDSCLYFGGVFASDWARWSYQYMSPDARARSGAPGPKTYAEARARWDELGVDAFQMHLPTLGMPYLRGATPWYYRWIQTGPYSPKWAWGDLRTKYGNVQAAVLNLSGWYDEAYGPEGAMTNFAGLLAARAGQSDPRTQLVIGPWTHGVESTRTTSSGERVFGPGSVIDYDAVVLDFLDHYVRDTPNGVQSQPRVRVYAMGEDRWYSADSLPLPGTQETTMLLGRSVDASRGSVSAQGRRGAAPSTTYTADPLHPVRDDLGTGFGAYDLAFLSGRPDVATFESGPFGADTLVLGALRGSLFVSLDRPDADLYMKVLDVAPNGRAYNLMSPGQEVVRISYRHRTATRQNVTPGKVVRVDFLGERTGNLFKAGHRLRVQIVSSWAPDLSRNLQTGKPESTSARTAVAHIRILHTSRYPSSLTLPVVKGTLP